MFSKSTTVAMFCPVCGRSIMLETEAWGTTPEERDYIIDRYFMQCTECKQQMIPIDVNIVCVIQILNSKGYPTLECCEGHYDEEHDAFTTPYIKFPESIGILVRSRLRLPRSIYEFKGTQVLNIKSDAFNSTYGGYLQDFERDKIDVLGRLKDAVLNLPNNKNKLSREVKHIQERRRVYGRERDDFTI